MPIPAPPPPPEIETTPPPPQEAWDPYACPDPYALARGELVA